MRGFVTLASALAICLLAVAACGGDDDSGGSATPASTQSSSRTATAAPASATQRGGGGGSHFVEIDAADFSFSPKQASATADVDLDFVISNAGQATHTFNLYRDADYTQTVEDGKTGNIASLTVGEFHVTLAAGEYFFRCEVHPQQMQGTLTVN